MVKVECNIATDPFLKKFDVNVDPKFLEIGARVLEKPKCEFVNGSPEFAPKENGKEVRVIFDIINVNNCVEWNQ
jgi:hypothetical protein